MSQPDFGPAKASWTPGLALAAYAEGWIAGAKVVVFGAATSPLPERLLERGARLVQVYDPDPLRVAEALALPHSRQISYTAAGAAASHRDGVFDFGLIEDLAALGQAPAQGLAALARTLSRRGMALVASRNPDALDALISVAPSASPPPSYYELFEQVNEHFPEVRMLGQTPFVGYAIADFAAEDDSDVRIDTAFLPNGAEEPEWFLALASRVPVSAEAFSVIQVPMRELGPRDTEAPEAPEAFEPAAGDAAEREAAERERAGRETAERERAGKETAERERAAKETAERERAAKETAERERAASEKKAAELSHRLEALQAELVKREEWLAGLEARAATADQRADEMQAELDQLSQKDADKQRELERAAKQLASERQASREAQERARSLEQRVEQLTKELASREKQALEQRQALEHAQARAGDEAVRAELDELEGRLRERGTEVARLEAALHETERFGRQLISELTVLRAARDGGSGRELDELLGRNAELAADLEAARWTISSLEAARGEAASSGAGASADPGPARKPVPARLD